MILPPSLISLSIEVCIPPEEEAIASKACGNKYKYCKKIVCRCPKQQKTTQRDQNAIPVNIDFVDATNLGNFR